MMKNWVKKNLGSISKINYGYTTKASFEKTDSHFLRITDIQENFVDWKNVPYCSVSENDYEKYKLIDNDIVFARTGATTGKSYLVKNPPKSVAASYLIRLRLINENILPEFIAKYFQTFEYWNTISSGIAGSAQGGFNASKLSDLVIPIPPIAEQKRIVEILDETFEKIERIEANTQRNLESDRELFDKYLDGIFAQRKDDWKNKKIADICTKVEYGSSSKSSKEKTENSIPVLRMGNMQGGFINWDNLVYTNKPEEIEKYLLKHNDVLFNRTNSDIHVGKTAIYKGKQPAIFAGYLIRINYKNDIINPDFLNFYLNSSIARNYGKSVMSRSINQANINGTKLKSYPIYMPSLEVQEKIVSDLYELQKETQKLESIYQRKLEALAEIKQSILQKAFTGQLTR